MSIKRPVGDLNHLNSLDETRFENVDQEIRKSLLDDGSVNSSIIASSINDTRFEQMLNEPLNETKME